MHFIKCATSSFTLGIRHKYAIIYSYTSFVDYAVGLVVHIITNCRVFFIW